MLKLFLFKMACGSILCSDEAQPRPMASWRQHSRQQGRDAAPVPGASSQPLQVPVLPPGGDPSAEDEPSAAALRMRRFRLKKKASGEWEQYRAAQNAFIKKSRAKQTPGQKETTKEHSKARARRFRAKRTASGLPVQKPKKNVTSHTGQNQREKDRVRQLEYRANLSVQKKTWINLKRREKRAAEKQRKLDQQQQKEQQQKVADKAELADVTATSAITSDMFSSPSPIGGYRSTATQWKAVLKAKGNLPGSPSKFAAVVDSL